MTTTMAMMLVDEGQARPRQARVARSSPRFRGGAKDTVTVRHAAHALVGARLVGAALQGAHEPRPRTSSASRRMDLAYEPGTKSLYSDLGLILLGEILERVAGEPIDSFARRRILSPLGMKDTQYKPPASLAGPHRAHRERPLARPRRCGSEVHDENAFAHGRDRAARGAVRHRARARALRADAAERRRVRQQAAACRATTLEMFTRPRRRARVVAARWAGTRPTARTPRARCCRRTRSGTPASRALRSGWIRTASCSSSCLTNRVHPTRENNAIRAVRRSVADAVVHAPGAALTR